MKERNGEGKKGGNEKRACEYLQDNFHTGGITNKKKKNTL